MAVLPGIELGYGVFRRFQAMPDGLPASIYFIDADEQKEKITETLLEGIKHYGYMCVTISDYWNIGGDLGIFNSKQVVISRLDISAPDWQPPDKKIQSEIRKAEREGVKLRPYRANRDRHHFLNLMKKTEKRHGRDPKYSPEFFDRLAVLAEQDIRVKWVVVEHGEELAAAHIYFVNNATALNWQVYFDKKFSFLKPNQFILYQVAKELAETGVRYLNLGISPGNTESLLTYKDKWGGKNYHYSILTSQNWLGKIF
jgi:hypothetical protein